MGLKIELNGKKVGYWFGNMSEDEAAQIASDESERLNAYVDDMFIMEDNDFVAVLEKNE